MKGIFILFSLFFIPLFCSYSYAQTWDWGRGSTGSLLDAWPIATDPSGNVFVAGSADGDVAFGTDTLTNAALTNYCVIAKYDTYGNFLWAKSTGSGYAYPINIATDQSGNSYLLGILEAYSMTIDTFMLINPNFPSFQYFLVKLNPSGHVLWTRTAGGAGNSIGDVLGGITNVLSSGGIATDTSGNVYIASNFNDSAVNVDSFTFVNSAPGSSTDDILLVKYDSSGNVKWAKSYGGSSNDEAYGLTVTPGGDIYIGGVFESPSIIFGPTTISSASTGKGNAFIARLNNAGIPVWASGSGGADGSFAAGVAADAQGNVYMTGGFLDNKISFSGTMITNTDSGKSVLYLVKFDSTNHVSWDKTIYDSDANIWGYTIAMSPCNNVWVGGDFSRPAGIPVTVLEVNIDGHILSASITGADPIFIAGYSAEGVYAGSASLLSGADDQLGIASDQGGNIFICADYETDVPFAVGTDTLQPGSGSGLEYLYVAKYTPLFTPVVSDTTFKNMDTILCEGAVLLTGPVGYFSYLWSNDSTSRDISVDTTGKYWVIAEKACAAIVSIDTFNVTYKSTISDTLFKTTDINICKSASIQLAASPGYTHYLWYNGNTNSTDNVDSAGTYWVAAFIPCTTTMAIDTFTIGVTDLTFSLGPDTVTCSPFTLSVQVPDVSYLWQNGSRDSFYNVSGPGTYYVSISKQGCVYTDTINVTAKDVSQHLNDTAFCRETFSEYTLFANAPAGSVVSWSNGDTLPSITVSDTGIYWVVVSDSSCVGRDTMTLSIALCNCEAFMPNAFTPNDDGVNDSYKPVFENSCVITDFSFSIYNRWGQEVFHSKNPDSKWDGTFQGIRAEMGTYMYYLKYSAGLYNTAYTRKGDVTLIR